MGERIQVRYGEEVIEVEIRRRDRSTLEIAVEPDATVVATAPMGATREAIAEKIRKRAGWVLRQQRFFSQYLPRTPERQCVAGETHLYLGRQYRLKIVQHIQAKVRLERGFINVQTHRPSEVDATRELLVAWYRERARERFAARIEKCVLRFADPEAFRPKALIIRQLAQRWGSMSPSGRLVLNIRLIEAPVDAIDYVVTHELCHMAEPHHGPRFFDLLERVMPDWEKRKARLERILA
jgi:predicted metal-dependent hydrolase